MKKYVLIILGILFLLVDVTVSTGVRYPEYELLDNYAADTQRMVMDDVVSDHMKLDAVPDAAGYVLLAAGALLALSADKGRKRALAVCAAAFAVDLLCPLLPLFAEGVTVYGGEYFLHWGRAFLEAAAVILIVRCCVASLESKINHRDNVLIWIFVMLAAACGFFRELAGFYGLLRTSAVYMVVQALLTLAYLWKLGGNARTAEALPEDR